MSPELCNICRSNTDDNNITDNKGDRVSEGWKFSTLHKKWYNINYCMVWTVEGKKYMLKLLEEY